MSTYEKADLFAADKHVGQFRRDGETPYILHPRTVVSILRDEAGVTDAITLQAAVLHDTIEDTDTTYDELRELFGDEVVSVVAEVTDDKSLPKAERKRLQVVHAPAYSDRAAAVKIADKTANLRDIIRIPPPWPTERKRAYYEHARSVVLAMGARHPELERVFNTAYLTGLSQLSDSK